MAHDVTHLILLVAGVACHYNNPTPNTTSTSTASTPITTSTQPPYQAGTTSPHYTYPHGEGDTTTSTVTWPPPNGCAPLDVKDHVDNWQAAAGCNTLGANSPCSHWDVSIIILLDAPSFSRPAPGSFLRDSHVGRFVTSDLNLQMIQNFINQITSNCDESSTMRLFTPWSIHEKDTPACAPVPLNSDARQTIEQLGTYDTTVGSDFNDTLNMLIMTQVNCVVDKPPLSRLGRVLFILLDVDCKSLCDADLMKSIQERIITLGEKNFLVHIIYIDDDNSDGKCITGSIFAVCKNNQDFCKVTIAGQSTVRVADLEPSMMVCRTSPAGDTGNGISTQELAWIIGVPSLVICIIVVTCVVFCYKRAKLMSTHWKRMWAYQQSHQPGINRHDTESVHYKSQFRAGTSTDAPPLHITMSNYLDIKQLSAVQKKDDWEVNVENLHVSDKCLGSGAFAHVMKGTLYGKPPLFVVNQTLNIHLENKDNHQCDVAVKRLPAHADEQSRMDFIHEIEFMKRLGYHGHILSMLGCVTNPYEPMIVIELCENGDLLRFLRNQKTHMLLKDSDTCPIDADFCLRIKDLVSIAWQISDGMTYLSSIKFIHRDLAARNVLLTKKLVAKISDFGLCRYVDSSLYTARGGRLPIKWMSLESLKYYEYSTKSDVWSFAILLYEVFTIGEAPFQGIQPLEMVSYLEAGRRLTQPALCPNEIFSLMERCWSAAPDERPDFSEIRGQLTLMLNMEDEQYGYLNLKNDDNYVSTKDMKNMLYRQISVHSLEESQHLSEEEVEMVDVADLEWRKKKKEKRENEENHEDTTLCPSLTQTDSAYFSQQSHERGEEVRQEDPADTDPLPHAIEDQSSRGTPRFGLHCPTVDRVEEEKEKEEEKGKDKEEKEEEESNSPDVPVITLEMCTDDGELRVRERVSSTLSNATTVYEV